MYFVYSLFLVALGFICEIFDLVCPDVKNDLRFSIFFNLVKNMLVGFLVQSLISLVNPDSTSVIEPIKEDLQRF